MYFKFFLTVTLSLITIQKSLGSSFTIINDTIKNSVVVEGAQNFINDDFKDSVEEFWTGVKLYNKVVKSLRKSNKEFLPLIYFISDVSNDLNANALSENLLYNNVPFADKLKEHIKITDKLVKEFDFPTLPKFLSKDFNINELNKFKNREKLRSKLNGHINQAIIWKNFINDANYLLKEHEFLMYDLNQIKNNTKKVTNACREILSDGAVTYMFYACNSVSTFERNYNLNLRKLNEKREKWEPKFDVNVKEFSAIKSVLLFGLRWEEELLKKHEEKYLKDIEEFTNKIGKLNTKLTEINSFRALKKDYELKIRNYKTTINSHNNSISSVQSDLRSSENELLILCTKEDNDAKYNGCESKTEKYNYSQCIHEKQKDIFDRDCQYKRRKTQSRIDSRRSRISKLNFLINNYNNAILKLNDEISTLDNKIKDEVALSNELEETISFKEQYENFIESFMTAKLLHENQNNQNQLLNL
jgi:hypothetical protein